MDKPGTVVVVGGTCELGKHLAIHYANKGYPVIVTSRDLGRAQTTASEIGGNCTGLAVDLANPHEIASALAAVEDVRHLALVALHRDENKVREYNIDEAIKLVTLKLVGYTECVHVLAPRMREDSSIVIFGGLARNQPYPGSTTITTVNGGVSTLINSLALELSPIRVNAIAPGLIDTPLLGEYRGEAAKWAEDKLPVRRIGLAEEVAQAVVLVMTNGFITGEVLHIDGGGRLI